MKNTGLTERYIEHGHRDARPCTAAHMTTANDSNPSGIAMAHRGFADRTGTWLEVWWLVDVNQRVTYVYEDTRGLNRR